MGAERTRKDRTMTDRINTRLITILSSTDRDKVTSAYMAIAKHFVDNCKDKSRYKVNMNRYLYELNELVIIDVELIKSMVVEYIEFYNYVTGVGISSRRYNSFLDSIGVEYCFSSGYISSVDKNIETYNTVLSLLKQRDSNRISKE